MTSQGFYGWGVLLIMLVAAADFEATSEIAAAFAVLLLVSVLLIYGPAAFGWLSSVVGAPAAVVPNTPTSGSGATGATRVGGTGGV